MKPNLIKISGLKSNPNNPRIIRDDKFEKLCKSVKDFPKMLEMRPIVVDEDMMVLGGNMRLKACKEVGIKQVPCTIFTREMAEKMNEEQGLEISYKDWCDEFIIKDNVGFGEWDWSTLANEWDPGQLSEWGLDVPDFSADTTEEGLSDKYTQKIEAPIYEPVGDKPKISEMVSSEKQVELQQKIEAVECDEDLKEFLRLASHRFNVFDFSKIANYYAHADKEVQQIMEDLALVIVDFDKAIENGFVKMSEDIASTFEADTPTNPIEDEEK